VNNSTTHNSSSLGPRAEVSKTELLLQDGSRFSGESFGSRCSTAGEVVFNTGMVGYPEAMTDPSYRGQILVLTYPLIGNYGVPVNEETKPSENELDIPEFFESNRIQISGLIIATLSKHYSHWSALGSLASCMQRQKIPGKVMLGDSQSLRKHCQIERGLVQSACAAKRLPELRRCALVITYPKSFGESLGGRNVGRCREA